MQVAQNIASQIGSLGSSYSSGVQAGQQQQLNQGQMAVQKGQLAIQQVQIDSAKNQEKYDKITQTLKLLEPGAISAAKNGGQKGLDEYKNKVSQNPQVATMFKEIGLDANNISFQVADGEIKSTGIKSQKVFNKPTVLDVNGTKTTLQPGAYTVDTEIRNGVPKITGISQNTNYDKEQQDLRKGTAEIGELGARAQYYRSQAGKAENTVVGKILPANSSAKLSEIKNSMDELEKAKTFLDDPKLKEVVGPVAGITSGLNPYNKTASKFRQYLATTKQLIAKGLEGGKLSDKDEKKYADILPKFTDPPEILKAKAEQLKQAIVSKYNNDLQTYQESGYNVSKIPPIESKQVSLTGSSTFQGEKLQTTPLRSGNYIQQTAPNSFMYVKKK